MLLDKANTITSTYISYQIKESRYIIEKYKYFFGNQVVHE